MKMLKQEHDEIQAQIEQQRQNSLKTQVKIMPSRKQNGYWRKKSSQEIDDLMDSGVDTFGKA